MPDNNTTLNPSIKLTTAEEQNTDASAAIVDSWLSNLHGGTDTVSGTTEWLKVETRCHTPAGSVISTTEALDPAPLTGSKLKQETPASEKESCSTNQEADPRIKQETLEEETMGRAFGSMSMGPSQGLTVPIKRERASDSGDELERLPMEETKKKRPEVAPAKRNGSDRYHLRPLVDKKDEQ